MRVCVANEQTHTGEYRPIRDYVGLWAHVGSGIHKKGHTGRRRPMGILRCEMGANGTYKRSAAWQMASSDHLHTGRTDDGTQTR